MMERPNSTARIGFGILEREGLKERKNGQLDSLNLVRIGDKKESNNDRKGK
jgi:hypothetical protein